MTDGLAIHLGDVPAHVLVKPLGPGSLVSGFAVWCNECGRGTVAYLPSIRSDPECVAKWVEEHRNCSAEGG